MSEGNNVGARLLSIVERIERLQEEADAVNADKSEVYKEAKGDGFEVKIIKKIVQRRRKAEQDVAEEDALFDSYMTAMMQAQGRRDPMVSVDRVKAAIVEATTGISDIHRGAHTAEADDPLSISQ